MKMKAKELMNLLRSAVDQELYFTFVDYDIHDYLDGDETEVVCSCRSTFIGEYFLNETILNGEVVSIGIKSDNEIVFELAEDWHEQKEEQITDVKIPSRILEVSVTKNELGLADVLIKDLKENEMLDIIQYLCEYTGTEAIFDKDGKWSIPLDKDNEGGENNGK
jgi:hypothetical protein